MESISWQSAVVAVSVIILIMGVGITAILRYSVGDALKIWGALSGITGVVIGTFTTFFFTRQPFIQAKEEAKAAIVMAKEAEDKLNKMKAEHDMFIYKVEKLPGQTNVASLRNSPFFKNYVKEHQ